MLNFIKRKKITSSIVALALIVIFATVVYAAYNERNKTIFWETVTTKKQVTVQDKMDFKADAEIISTKNLYPANMISNSELAIWSGGTRWGSGGLSSVPDGWYIPSTSTYTGVTRIDVNTIAPVSSVTPEFIHSMYVNVWDATNAIAQSANTKFILFPGSGVSTTAAWYKKFAGHNVTFGAWMKRDLAVHTAAGVTTNFIRPVMNSHSVHLSACSDYWKLGDFVENDGWTLATVTWDVPANASAFEYGFAMNPTVLAPKTTSGDSVYVVAPFLLINPLHKKYVPGDKTIWFENAVGFDSNGATFDLAAGTSDFNIEDRTGGKIPPNVDSLYVVYQGQHAAAADQVSFRSDTGHLTGATFYAPGTVVQTHATWVKCDNAGDFDLYTSSTVNGVSIFVTGAKLK